MYFKTTQSKHSTVKYKNEILKWNVALFGAIIIDHQLTKNLKVDFWLYVTLIYALNVQIVICYI